MASLNPLAGRAWLAPGWNLPIFRVLALRRRQISPSAPAPSESSFSSLLTALSPRNAIVFATDWRGWTATGLRMGRSTAPPTIGSLRAVTVFRSLPVTATASGTKAGRASSFGSYPPFGGHGGLGLWPQW